MQDEFRCICFIAAGMASLFANAAAQFFTLALWAAGVWYERRVGIYGD